MATSNKIKDLRRYWELLLGLTFGCALSRMPGSRPARGWLALQRTCVKHQKISQQLRLTI